MYGSREIEAVADTESDAITFVPTRSEHADPTTTWITADVQVVVDVRSAR